MTEKNIQPHLNKSHQEYTTGVVRFLENYLGLNLTPDQVRTWIVKLSQYSRWHLLKLGDGYSGGKALVDVCRWLDDLRPEPEQPRQDIADYSRPQLENRPNISMAKKCLEYVKQVTSVGLTAEQKDVLELDFIAAIQKEHPHLSLHCVRKTNWGK